jgi:hypothetical protein
MHAQSDHICAYHGAMESHLQPGEPDHTRAAADASEAAGAVAEEPASFEPAVAAGTARRKVLILSSAAVAVIVAVCAVVLLGRGDEQLRVRGVFILKDSENVVGGWDRCRGDGGYDDFGPGMNVTIRDGAGRIIGAGNTEAMRPLPPDLEAQIDDPDTTIAPEYMESEDEVLMMAMLAKIYDGTQCFVYFEVDVEEADFYSVEVGSRGDLTYSAEELADRDYWIELSLG